MKNIITLLVLLLMLPIFIAAQTYNTKLGYLITTTGDTLHGLIRDHANLSQEVSFKTTSESDFKTYTPDNILAFIVESAYYEAKELENQKVFLQVLVKGTLSLYQGYTETVFYLQKNNGALRKLEKRDSVIGNAYKIDTRYQNVLYAFTSDCPESKRSIDRMSFSNRDLQRVAETYNNCINPEGETKVFKASTKLRIQKGAKAGWFSNKMRFVTESQVFLGNNSSTESSFSGGIFARLSFKEKWGLQPELLFTKKSGTIDARTVIGTGDINVFSFTYLQIPLSIYYTFPTNKIKPFVFAGGLIGLPLEKEAYRIKDNQELPLTFSLQEDELGYRGGAGVQWQLKPKLALQMEYLYESTLTNRLSVVNKIGNTSHSIKLGVLF